MDSLKPVGLLPRPDKDVLNCIQNKDVSVVELFPVDGGKLSNDRLTLALDDEQLGLFLVADNVQAGGDTAVQDSEERKQDWFEAGFNGCFMVKLNHSLPKVEENGHFFVFTKAKVKKLN